MANIAPVAVVEASATILTLPDNVIKLDAGKSYDPNLKGQIVLFEFYQQDGPSAVKLNVTSETTCDCVAPAIIGKYTVGVKVTDRGGLSGTAEVQFTVKQADVKTIFGASGPTIDSVATLESVCVSLKAPTRTSTILSSYRGGGKKELETYIDAGHPTFWNINWASPDNSSGVKTGAPFPTDLKAYSAALASLLSYYRDYPKKDLIWLVFENEPTTDAFHDGPMSDYIAELKAAVIVAKGYGYKNIVDGAVHIGTILGANDGDPNSTNKSQQVAYLLSEYANIPELLYINAHTTNTGTLYNSQDIVDADAKCFGITGRHLISNECHVKNVEAVKGMCEGYSKVHAPFVVYISGTNPSYALNSGTNLTPIGGAYQQYINSVL